MLTMSSDLYVPAPAGERRPAFARRAGPHHHRPGQVRTSPVLYLMGTMLLYLVLCLAQRPYCADSSATVLRSQFVTSNCPTTYAPPSPSPCSC